jgi:hypothetical protein
MLARPWPYKTPYLCVDKIDTRGESRAVELVHGGRRLSLMVEGQLEGAAKLLEDLRRPRSAGWQAPAVPLPGPPGSLVETLDRFGWIRDADESGRAICSSERDSLESTAEQSVAWLRGARECLASAGDAPAMTRFTELLAAVARETRFLVDQRARGLLQRDFFPGRLSGLASSVPGIALWIALRAWERTSPAALAVLVVVTERAMAADAGSGPSAGGTAGPALIEETCWLTDVGGVRNQVWSACLLLAAAASSRAPIFDSFVPGVCEATSGPNTIVTAEGCAELLMEALGGSDLFRLIERRGVSGRVATGVYLHQYFITIRYIESVLSFLRFRLRNPLRRIGLEYLVQENGHEVHEREACRRLGVSDADLERFAPLALFEVYSDILGYVAETDPLAFCLSIAVAEGMPGQKKPIADALAAQGLNDPAFALHAELDLELDHSYFPRRLFSGIPWVGGAAIRDSVRRFLFVLEMSQLGWDQVARYAENELLPVVPTAFGLAPADAFRVMADSLGPGDARPSRPTEPTGERFPAR